VSEFRWHGVFQVFCLNPQLATRPAYERFARLVFEVLGKSKVDMCRRSDQIGFEHIVVFELVGLRLDWERLGPERTQGASMFGDI
jgi:hypothetical protein